MRNQGKKHIDIWSDGRLYPVDPITKSSPPFFGERDILKLENNILKQEKDSLLKTVEQSKERISILEKNLEALRRKQTMLGSRLRSKKLRNIETLKR